jgi:hypothetical protein
MMANSMTKMTALGCGYESGTQKKGLGLAEHFGRL